MPAVRRKTVATKPSEPPLARHIGMFQVFQAGDMATLLGALGIAENADLDRAALTMHLGLVRAADT